MNSKKWTQRNIPDLTGKIVLITGANSGLGLENTKQFTAKGAKVIMACRNLEKADKAKSKIRVKNPEADIEVMQLDLANLKSIENFANEYKSKYNQLNVLLNNAGIMMVPYGKTVDGFERQVGINHLGHFALTAQLYDVLKSTSAARIVSVSSMAHSFGNMDWNDFLFEKEYSRTAAYGRSKLANLLFTYEMDRRFRSKEIDITAVASHPGIAATNLGNHFFGPRNILKPIIVSILLLFMGQSAARGALPSSRAATDSSVKSGEFYGPTGIFGGHARGFPKLAQSNSNSHNLEDAKHLWKISEELTGVTFNI